MKSGKEPSNCEIDQSVEKQCWLEQLPFAVLGGSLRRFSPLEKLIFGWKRGEKRGEKRSLDCKTVRIFAYSSTREQPNKRSGTKLKTQSKTGERR